MSAPLTGAALCALVACGDAALLSAQLMALPPGERAALLQVSGGEALAAADGRLRVLEVLLRAGVPADAPDAKDMTALQRGVMQGDVAAVTFLLTQGADPARRVPREAAAEYQGLNCFHLAVFADAAVLQALLVAPDHAGLYDRAVYERLDVDTLRLALREGQAAHVAVLTEFGVSLNARGADNRTPLQFLIAHRKSNVAGMEALRYLVDHGADPHRSDSATGETLLHLAASAGWAEAFFFMLEQGISPAAVMTDGTTLLHAAARGPREDIFQAVMAMKPDIDARNKQGETPLYAAAHRNRRAHVAALLDAGADPTIADRRGRTPDEVCQGPLQQATHALVSQAKRRWIPSKRGTTRGPRGIRPSNRR